MCLIWQLPVLASNCMASKQCACRTRRMHAHGAKHHHAHAREIAISECIHVTTT